MGNEKGEKSGTRTESEIQELGNLEEEVEVEFPIHCSAGDSFTHSAKLRVKSADNCLHIQCLWVTFEYSLTYTSFTLTTLS
jgi:hypothetical protein